MDHWTDLQSQRQTLVEQQCELEAEIAEVQEALIELAEKKDLSTIVGTEKEVAVTIAEAVLFPTKGSEPEEYAAFEAKLRKSKYWPEVSAMDRSALKRLWDQREELDAVLRRWLTTYARSERQVGIRLRNRRG